ncbi:Uncharacterized protein APZ42_014659 [Daphnia magna]|uniref:Uncharacterized protein n=1 Tax=Daphnia magna TaxID=35525 RepID=A0A162PPL1_9CRUS|nr:Uncharacterized protein APZ42_014659 [Daphnia magna]
MVPLKKKNVRNCMKEEYVKWRFLPTCKTLVIVKEGINKKSIGRQQRKK